MPVGLKPVCFDCTRTIRLGAAGWTCDAFAVIPVEVLAGRSDHSSPIEGDGGKQFVARKFQDEGDYCPVSKDELQCQNCVKYVAANTCKILTGSISPVGWCPSYEASGYTIGMPGTLIEDISDGEVARADAEVDKHLESGGSGEAESRGDSSEGLLAAAGVMIVTKDGKVLMLKRADSGQWAFPGGGIEDDDASPEAAAIRECVEEIGYRPQLHGQWTRRIADGVDFTTFVSHVPHEFVPELNDEHTDHRWLPIGDLASAAVRKIGLA